MPSRVSIAFSLYLPKWDVPESSNNFKELQKVISQSDQLREWFDLLPEQEYRIKASEYITNTYNCAENLQQWRNAAKLTRNP